MTNNNTKINNSNDLDNKNIIDQDNYSCLVEDKNNEQLEFFPENPQNPTYAIEVRNLNDNARKKLRNFLFLLPVIGVVPKLRLSNSVILVLSEQVRFLDIKQIKAILNIVINYNDFNINNDPYTEHDFAKFSYNSEDFYWKIDYYDQHLEYLSEDPADQTKTNRVLTIAYMSEY